MGRVVIRRDLELLCGFCGLWLWLLLSSVLMKILLLVLVLPDEELGGDEENEKYSCLLVCLAYDNAGVAWRSEVLVMPQNNDMSLLSQRCRAGNDRMEMFLLVDLANKDDAEDENAGALRCEKSSKTGALLDTRWAHRSIPKGNIDRILAPLIIDLGKQPDAIVVVYRSRYGLGFGVLVDNEMSGGMKLFYLLPVHVPVVVY